MLFTVNMNFEMEKMGASFKMVPCMDNAVNMIQIRHRYAHNSSTLLQFLFNFYPWSHKK